MRTARIVTAGASPAQPALILTAHGSVDPRSAAVTHAIAGRIQRLRPEIDVRVAFLERATPALGTELSATGPAVVVPMLLADGYHARTDIPGIIAASGVPNVLRAPVLGADPALLQVLRQRLTEVGVSDDDRDVGVLVVAVGSTNAAANAGSATVARSLRMRTRWAGAGVAFATGPQPTLADTALRLRACGARRIVIAPWFLAHGKITDRVAEFARAQGISMAESLGSHSLVAATALDRYEAALTDQAAA
jgi:sirohydrochlorin ferrochelatase